jgi:hypothetical protein
MRKKEWLNSISEKNSKIQVRYEKGNDKLNNTCAGAAFSWVKLEIMSENMHKI